MTLEELIKNDVINKNFTCLDDIFGEKSNY